MRADARKSAVFIAATLIVSAAVAGGAWGLGVRLGTVGGMVLMVGFMFIPMSVALVLEKLVYGETSGAVRWTFNRWWIVAWLAPAALALAAAVATPLLMPGVHFSAASEYFCARTNLDKPIPIPPPIMALMALAGGLVAGATINAVAAFGEEYGWRGFLTRHLSFLGFWKSSLLVGFVWGIWHAPLILQGHNYPEHPQLGVLFMIVLCVLASPLLALVRLRGGSVIPAAIFHGTINATAGASMLFVAGRGASDLTVGFTGLPGLIVLALANVVALVALRQRRQPAPLVPTTISAGALT